MSFSMGKIAFFLMMLMIRCTQLFCRNCFSSYRDQNGFCTHMHDTLKMQVILHYTGQILCSDIINNRMQHSICSIQCIVFEQSFLICTLICINKKETKQSLHCTTTPSEKEYVEGAKKSQSNISNDFCIGWNYRDIIS